MAYKDIKAILLIVHGYFLLQEIKLLVIGHHKAVLDQIQDSLTSGNIQHIRIDGSTNDRRRSELVKCFQSQQECRVVLLSIQAAGVFHAGIEGPFTATYCSINTLSLIITRKSSLSLPRQPHFEIYT